MADPIETFSSSTSHISFFLLVCEPAAKAGSSLLHMGEKTLKNGTLLVERGKTILDILQPRMLTDCFRNMKNIKDGDLDIEDSGKGQLAPISI